MPARAGGRFLVRHTRRIRRGKVKVWRFMKIAGRDIFYPLTLRLMPTSIYDTSGRLVDAYPLTFPSFLPDSAALRRACIDLGKHTHDIKRFTKIHPPSLGTF